MAYNDKPVKPTSKKAEHSSSSRRRRARSSGTHGRISQTKTQNTKDYKDWVSAGKPDKWPQSKKKSEPKRGRRGPDTKADLQDIFDVLRKRRKSD